MACSWEVAAGRFTKDECVALGVAHGLFAPAINPVSFAATLPDVCHVRGFNDALWYNSGDFDPALTPGTEFDYAGFRFVRGGLFLAGDHSKPWTVWAWQKAQYDADPSAFLASCGMDDSRISDVSAPIVPTTTAEAEENYYRVMCHKKPRGNHVTDRLLYPSAKPAIGYANAAKVSREVPISLTTLRITTSRPDNVHQFSERMISFGPTKDDAAIQLVGGIVVAGPDATGLTVDGGMNNFPVGTRVLITGCNEGRFNRTATVVLQSNDTSIIVDIDDVDNVADQITVGSLQRIDRYFSQYCKAATQIDAYEVDCEFDPPLATVPFVDQYVSTMANTISETGYEFDQTLQGLADILLALPEGHRQIGINAPMSICDEANVKMTYQDGQAGGKVIPFDLHWEVQEPWLRWYFEWLNEKLVEAGTELNSFYLDWEGIAAWWFQYSKGIGTVDQLVEEHVSGDYTTQWGFQVTDAYNTINQTPVLGNEVTENQMKYMLIGNENNRVGWEYSNKVGGLIREVFGDHVVMTNFRSGSLGISHSRSPLAMTIQGSPLSTFNMPNVRPDSIAVWRQYMKPETRIPSFWEDTPTWVRHPYSDGVDEELYRYATIENAWQFHQAGSRLWSQPAMPTTYGLQEDDYAEGIGGTPWVFDQYTHVFMASDIDQVTYYNFRSTEDKDMEDLVIEWNYVFPRGVRKPVVLENPGDGGPWENAYVHSINDSRACLIHYFTMNPSVTTTFTQVGDDVHVICASPHENQNLVITNAVITVPPARVTSGVWVTQSEFAPLPSAESWLQYIRRGVAELIEKNRSEGKYIFNDFVVKETYYPAENIETIGETPMCWVVGLGSDSSIATRGAAYTRSQPIEIAFQSVLDSPHDTATIDMYVKLIEQLKDTASGLFLDRIQWEFNATRRDASGGIVNFVGLREAHAFESYFTSSYRYVATDGEDPPS